MSVTRWARMGPKEMVSCRLNRARLCSKVSVSMSRGWYGGAMIGSNVTSGSFARAGTGSGSRCWSPCCVGIVGSSLGSAIIVGGLDLERLD